MVDIEESHMFVQFIQGPVGDADALRHQYDRWHAELAGDAPGWLGSTGGVTADGTGFVAARFASADDAQRNASRPEQDAWWQQTEAAFSGPVDFFDSEDVELMRGGGSDDAGFVQVIRGRMRDLEEARRLLQDLEAQGGPDRDDVLGGVVGLQEDGSFVQVVYFTSEADARTGEQADAESGDPVAERMQQLLDGPPVFLDLTDPWLASP